MTLFVTKNMVHGIPTERFIASWYIAGGKNDRPKIEKWLQSITIDGKHLNEDEVDRLAAAITNGKMELEESARDFV